MGTITDGKGNVIGEFAETLEDWKQAAEVEAGIRSELEAENKRLRSACRSAYDVIFLRELFRLANDPDVSAELIGIRVRNEMAIRQPGTATA